ncbi:MAG: chlororespiratory reduction 6 domain-containing protein [Burkholderiaceae bacterium]
MHTPYSGMVGSHVVIAKIDRADIESRNVAPASAALNRLVESSEALINSNGTISLMVSGYDDDPRELHMIPEVRDYFVALDADFPYWFHICTRLDHTLRMLFMMIADPLPALNDSATVQYLIANDDLNEFLNRRMEAIDMLHAKFGFDEAENVRIGELVLNYFASLIPA